MEGYTDVIVAHQYGFTNAVAVLGTALGESHIRILKAHADRIVLVLDGDEAGTKRANEVLELFVAQQADLRILTLPEELDPCDYLHKYGAEAFSRTAGRRRRSTPWITPSRRRRAASTWSGTFTARARRGAADLRSWPRRRGCGGDTTPRRPLPRGEDLAAAGGAGSAWTSGKCGGG